MWNEVATHFKINYLVLLKTAVEMLQDDDMRDQKYSVSHPHNNNK